jgi:hypothetical protein
LQTSPKTSLTMSTLSSWLWNNFQSFSAALRIGWRRRLKVWPKRWDVRKWISPRNCVGLGVDGRDVMVGVEDLWSILQ